MIEYDKIAKVYFERRRDKSRFDYNRDIEVPAMIKMVCDVKGYRLQENPLIQVEINDNSCPRHIYGTEDSGFYGAYDMQQKDLNDDELQWIKANCPRTTWSEHMEGYKWMLNASYSNEESDNLGDKAETYSNENKGLGVCGDGVCDLDESNCQDDCKRYEEEKNYFICGDGICDTREKDCQSNRRSWRHYLNITMADN